MKLSFASKLLWRFLCIASAIGCSSGPPSASRAGVNAGVNPGANAGVDAGAAPVVAIDSNGCPIGSGYAGDDACLAAPSSDKGLQLHYGPKDYNDPAEIAQYILPSGHEQTDCYYLKTPNDSDVYVAGYQFSLRPGSHHLMVNVNSAAQPDGFAPCGLTDQSPGLLGGAIKPKVDNLTEMAPENVGIVVKLPANSQAVLNMHAINATDAPSLREAWLNYVYADPSEVKGIRGNVFLEGGFGFQITPGTSKTYSYACSPQQPTRILSITAHMHAHNTRLTAWKVTNGQASLIYENYSWSSPVELHYDSAHQNPTPDRAGQVAGGASGQVVLQPTDSLQWECAIDNSDGDTTLKFRNEVYTGEMCNVTGTMVRADDPMHTSDFTCLLN